MSQAIEDKVKQLDRLNRALFDLDKEIVSKEKVREELLRRKEKLSKEISEPKKINLFERKTSQYDKYKDLMGKWHKA